MSGSEIFATVNDLRARLSPGDAGLLTGDGATHRAQTLIFDASSLIQHRCPGWEVAPRLVLTSVVCRIVIRALRQRPAGIASDASQFSQTTGPFSQSVQWSSPSGEVFLTRQDRDDINGASGSFFGCADTLFGGVA